MRPQALILSGFLLLIGTISWADVGQIKNVTGRVSLSRNNAERVARPGDLVETGDVIITGADSSVGIIFIDNSRMSAGSDSRLRVLRFDFDPKTKEGEFETEISKGTLTMVSGDIAKSKPGAVRVKTPTTLLTLRGTRIAVKVEE